MVEVFKNSKCDNKKWELYLSDENNHHKLLNYENGSVFPFEDVLVGQVLVILKDSEGETVLSLLKKNLIEEQIGDLKKIGGKR